MNLQQIQLLASQLETATRDQFSNYGVTLLPSGAVQICKLRWYQRLICYFCPERYSALPHIPKIAELALQAFRQEPSAIDYIKFTDNVEKSLFFEVTQNRKRIEQSKILQLSANIALQHLFALRNEAGTSPQDKLAETIAASLKRLIANPIDSPYSFFTIWFSLKDSEQNELLQHKKIKPLASRLADRLFQILTGLVPFSIPVGIKPCKLLQKSEPIQIQNPKLRRWQSIVPNYKAVCNTLDRRPLSCVVINGKTLPDTLTKQVSNKVPMVCEKLLSAAKGPRETFEETLLPIVGEMAAMMAIELPNPISISPFLYFLYNAVRPDLKLYAHEDKGSSIDHEFSLENLHATYTTSRRYKIIKVDGQSGEQIQLARIDFVSKMEKNFASPSAPWSGTLSTVILSKTM